MLVNITKYYLYMYESSRFFNEIYIYKEDIKKKYIY